MLSHGRFHPPFATHPTGDAHRAYLVQLNNRSQEMIVGLVSSFHSSSSLSRVPLSLPWGTFWSPESAHLGISREHSCGIEAQIYPGRCSLLFFARRFDGFYSPSPLERAAIFLIFSDFLRGCILVEVIIKVILESRGRRKCR